MSKVFISSTSLDLKAYRAVAIEECNRLGLVPLAMEYFPAMGLGAVAGSMARLDEADLYVGIFAHRYGYVEAGHERSVTEIEFDYAGETRRLERLCYLVDPNYPWPDEARETTNRARLEAFHQKVQTGQIRDLYTTPVDFQGKLRLALIDWRQRQGARFVRQPPLSLRLLDPTPENRLKHGAGATAFVGRAAETAALARFLEGDRPVSWLVVAGPPGSGKSRLVQEFCRGLDTSWRAGFLADEGFDWLTWQPEVRTLIAIDYASEHVGEIGVLLRTLAQRADAARGAPVRIALIERDPAGRWIDELIGHRSEGYALEQIRHPASPLVLGPLGEQELWEAVAPRLPMASQGPGVRAAFVEAMRAIDPAGRPLFWMLAADAVAAGRNIRDWDRARLMRDVLAREAEGWRNRHVPPPYLDLLALSTLAGGLTEAALETGPGLELPGFDGFDRGLYQILSGCSLDGDALPALKPDLIGEFFVLEHLLGRNDAVTARRTALYANAAWRLCGGSRRIALGPIQYRMPSRLVLRLHQMLEDYPDHPALPHLFARPRDVDVDLHFWADLVGYAVSRLVRTGHVDAARVLFETLRRFDEEEARTWDVTSGLIVAGFALLDHERARGNAGAVETLVRDLLAAQLDRPNSNAAFCREAAKVVPGLLAAQLDAHADLLMGRQLDIMRAHPDEDTLPAYHADALRALVAADRPIAQREQVFERLRIFAQEHRGNFIAFPALASAARALCAVYANGGRLPEALRMNQTIRGLVRLREQARVARTVQDFEAPLPFGIEEVTEDLRAMRSDLAGSDVLLIDLMTQAAQHRDADTLLDEVARLWLRCYPGDAQFANYRATAIMAHADACAKARQYGQTSKAVEALDEIRDKFPGVPELAGHASRLALKAVVRAVEAGDLDDARPLLDLMERDASEGRAAVSIANFADAALALCVAFQDANREEEMLRTARAGAWALRSAEFAVVLRERGGEEAVAEMTAWIGSLGEAAKG